MIVSKRRTESRGIKKKIREDYFSKESHYDFVNNKPRRAIKSWNGIATLCENFEKLS